jgi:hypothetical protein
MSGPTFPPARIVAARIEAFFARHRADAIAHGRAEFAPAPDAETIETLIDAAFWASLRREEGLTPKISLAFLPIETANDPLALHSPLPLDAAGLAKLAPAVERPGIHLCAWPIDGTLRVWGTTRNLPALCFVIEVVASGLLVIKQRGEPFGKFINVAVIEGDQIKIVDERTANLPECPGVLKSFMHADVFDQPSNTMNVLVELAASMRQHGRGGTLLVVPAAPGGATWTESIVNPITYAVNPPFAGLSSLLAQPSGVSQDEWQDDLHRAVEAIAGLTAVDGATLLSDHLELLAFGAKIIRRRGQPIVERVVVTEPIEGSVMTIAAPAQLGGTRHLSAAQFVHDQRNASALVASQDGRFTIFTWSPAEDAVHAHRIEALLL